MNVLESCDSPTLKYHSTISQHKNTLCVMKKGEWCPIAFDSIDSIVCDTINCHQACVTDGDDIGFHYHTGECKVFVSKPVYHDRNQIVLQALPEWFGSGYYEEQLTGQAFINADNGALGDFNMLTLRIGTNYVKSSDTIEPVA